MSQTTPPDTTWVDEILSNLQADSIKASIVGDLSVRTPDDPIHAEAKALILAHETQAVREAHIEELEMTLAMKGKKLVAGVLIDIAKYLDTNPDVIDPAVLEQRLKQLESEGKL